MVSVIVQMNGPEQHVKSLLYVKVDAHMVVHAIMVYAIALVIGLVQHAKHQAKKFVHHHAELMKRVNTETVTRSNIR